MWDTEDQPTSPLADLAWPDGIILSYKRIERFRQRVSISLASSRASEANGIWFTERLSMYRLHTRMLSDLEQEIQSTSGIIPWYLAVARLHFHAFFLLDDPTMKGFSDRICTLYNSASSLLAQKL
ncbi:hypothetical protein B0I35DRAFT_434700 [Stachybotrys elegans]|uniref:Uncharacterized protein n=1 Tax=Stachybotrys elegans TaxID=80388 RepID=A0A8K0SRU8_9HYPO|nr:hypothetical protein B0I35DRAFT_434700 [Stachybotrys elegans]